MLPTIPCAGYIARQPNLLHFSQMWIIRLILFTLLLAQTGGRGSATEAGGSETRVPILAYHRFGPAVADLMTVKTAVFLSQLEYLRAHGYVVIPLRRLVQYIAGLAPPPPPHSVVITADDGHKSVYTDMFPLIRRYHVPVTLFIYPSAISNARYALTWGQLASMRDSGLVDIQSHTYWHPNFRVEKKRLSPDEYGKFVRLQLAKSREALEQKLGGQVDMLSWPFGIYDGELMQSARQAGYIAAVTLERRPAGPGDDPMALPRYLMVNAVQGKSFASLLDSAVRQGRQPSPRPNKP